MEELECGPVPQAGASGRAMHEFLLRLTGRYLHCISSIDTEAIQFTYSVRQEARGFLKLDVLDEIIVVGVDTRTGPADRFSSFVEKAFLLHESKGFAEMSFVVPIVVFGVESPYLFYVESMRGFAWVSPYFIDAAQEFLASRILPDQFQMRTDRIRHYLDSVGDSGEDPLEVVARQPLFNNLLYGIPDEPRREMVKQIATEARRRLDL